MKFIDLTGRKFGRYLVLGHYPIRYKERQHQWLCKCDCGTIRVVVGQNLTRGNSNSCGCLTRKMTSKANSTHRLSGTKIYKKWISMKKRCSTDEPHYKKYYKDRGITVCERWKKFENFFEDMGASFLPHLEIDRIDNDKGYFPENCRWATRKEQVRNTRLNHNILYNGEIKSIAEWAEQYSIPYQTLWSRIKYGWDIGRALLEPLRRWPSQCQS